MMPLPRRRILRSLGSIVGITWVAGCTVETRAPAGNSQQPDLVLKNCHSESKAIQITVTYVANDEIVHDETHTVPENYCSDMGPGKNISDVWTQPGEYRIDAEVQGMAPVEETVTLSEGEVKNDTGTRVISVDDGEIQIR